jgi:RNA polymerase sigma-70 factor (ECF subfamily)
MVDVTEWFEQDVMRLLPQLLSTARGMCRNAADAEDLVAEAIARAWRHKQTLRERERLRGWLFGS